MAKRCWAEDLGDCEGGLSGEHLVSEAFFSSKEIKIQGFKWCKDEPAIVGLSRLTSNILCRNHNSSLSILDSEAGKVKSVVSKHLELCERRNLRPFSRSDIRRFFISAQNLERWLLKTLINLTFNGPYKIGLGADLPGTPSKNLIRIAFGFESFPDSCGMFIPANPGMKLNMGEYFQFSPLINKDINTIIGGYFDISGIPVFLSLTENGHAINPLDIPNLEEKWHSLPARQKPDSIKILSGARLSHIIQFKW